MFKRGGFFLLLFFVLAFKAKAQFDAQFSQYWVAKNLFNPAVAGTTEDMNLAMQFRQQWVGVENAPVSFVFCGDLPAFFIGKQHGLGLVLSNETIGLYSNMVIGAQYSYSFPLFRGNLSIGAQIGVASSKFDGSKVQIPSSGAHNPIDPNIPTTEESGMGFDVGLGIYYNHKRFHLGISMAHITQSSIDLGENVTIYVPSVIYLNAGYNHKFSNSLLEFRPSMLFKSDMIISQLDLNALFWYNSRFFGGLGYRLGDAVSILVGGEFSNFRFGYSYDLSHSAIGRASSGSHELFVGYRYKFDLNKSFLNQGRKRSVRFL
ncbi:MAG: PorP/SprF family type IX secretion system membrane protein [Bacteroidales bacterium]